MQAPGIAQKITPSRGTSLEGPHVSQRTQELPLRPQLMLNICHCVPQEPDQQHGAGRVGGLQKGAAADRRRLPRLHERRGPHHEPGLQPPCGDADPRGRQRRGELLVCAEEAGSGAQSESTAAPRPC